MLQSKACLIFFWYQDSTFIKQTKIFFFYWKVGLHVLLKTKSWKCQKKKINDEKKTCLWSTVYNVGRVKLTWLLFFSIFNWDSSSPSWFLCLNSANIKISLSSVQPNLTYEKELVSFLIITNTSWRKEDCFL